MGSTYPIRGESFVLCGDEALPFRHRPVASRPIVLRSRYEPDHPDNADYEEGVDYLVDRNAGTIRRTAGSRIRDGGLHPLNGVDDFDHTQFGNTSNLDFTVYADYETEADEVAAETALPSPDELARFGKLPRLAAKLSAGEEALYVVYGDSISVGYEASRTGLSYAELFGATLRAMFGNGRLRIANRAIGGETSRGGAARLLSDVVSLAPDLVTIGYGMNDQNKHGGGNAIPLPEYERHMRTMIETIRGRVGSDVVLVTPCEPNPRWMHASGDMSRYAETLRRLGAEYGIEVADAHSLWRNELTAGKTTASLLLNHLNHPNDYGHSIYHKAFLRMLRA